VCVPWLHAAVIGFVEEIEASFASMLRSGEFERLRVGPFTIADTIDPGGALGVGDRTGR
jgi:hypothetical protein